MLQKADIERFYEDLKLLELRMAGASIVKATKESKGNVSAYINRKREPSENFLKRFYESFGKEITKKRGEIEQIENPKQEKNQPLDMAGLSITVQEHINVLIQARDFAQRMAEVESREIKKMIEEQKLSLAEQRRFLVAIQSDLVAKAKVALDNIAILQNPKKPPKLNEEADRIASERQGMIRKGIGKVDNGI